MTLTSTPRQFPNGGGPLISAHVTTNTPALHESAPGTARVFLSYWDASGGPEVVAKHATANVSVFVAGAQPGDTARAWVIDDSISATLKWVEMGSPAQPSAAQLAELKAHSEMKPAALSWVAAEGGATARVVLPPNSGAVLELV